MRSEHAARVLELLGGFSPEAIGQTRIEKITHAVFFGKSPDEAAVQLIMRDVPFTAQQEPYMSAAIAAFVTAHASWGRKLFPLIFNEVSRNPGAVWRFLPALVIGALDAGAWFDKHPEDVSPDFHRLLPVHIGMLLREYIARAPGDDPNLACSKWALGRMSESLRLYTSAERDGENVRRIAFLVGKMSECSRPYPKCVQAFTAQVGFRAQMFIDPGSLIRCIHCEMNSERIIPADADAA